MTDVPQIFQPDDPRQGLFAGLIGDSDWKYSNQFGAGNKGMTYDASGKPTSSGEGIEGEREGNEYGNYSYKEGEVSSQEPGAYRANDNRANRGGILESGINQGRINTIAGRFANQRYWNTKGHTEATQTFGHERSEGEHGHTADVNTKMAEARIKAWERVQEQQAQAAQAAQAAAAAAAATGLAAKPQTFPVGVGWEATGPAGPGGVVPSVQQGPGGFVKVGQPQKKKVK